MENMSNKLMDAAKALVDALNEEMEQRELRMKSEIESLKEEISLLSTRLGLKEEELAQARLAVEAATLKAAEEEAARKAAEEEAARKAAEEETARRAAEEEAARKAAEEEAARKAAEEEAARKAAEEEAARKAAEEEAARKAAEEEAARRTAEEEAARKAAEEEAAKAPAIIFEPIEEEAESADSKPLFAPAEAKKPVAPAPEPVMETIDGNQYEPLFTPEDHNSTSSEVSPENGESSHPAKVQQPSLFDYLGSTQKTTTLADKIGYKRPNIEEQLESKVAQKKVDDLRQIININDKFSFMNELFHNNMKAYTDFLLKLNSLTSREEGLQAVAEVAEKYNWDDSSLAVRTFYKYFDRKF